jgi:dTDP-glucose 4,6-dehydratase
MLNRPGDPWIPGLQVFVLGKGRLLSVENTILVTGGAGFIGSNFILRWMEREDGRVVNLDKLTYAGNPRNLERVFSNPRYTFVKGDIGDRKLVAESLLTHKPRAVLHFAAESHVDRSILEPDGFVRTNVHGTFSLLEEARAYWSKLNASDQESFRFLQVSTDEVYGSLGAHDSAFTELTAYAPNSPYSASKAAADHLVRAYHHTYQLPTLTTNCSNNYGPFQFPEKLIPLMIHNARSGKPLPIYGDGKNVRDWLYVGDHCAALRTMLADGHAGSTYNVGGWNEKTNLEIVETICSLLNEFCPKDPVVPHRKLINFVTDRPGHDRRYAINARKIERDLQWHPRETFESGIRKTIFWYLENDEWTKEVTSGAYRQWMETQYATRDASARPA